MEANVILAKCSTHNKPFGIRIEKRNGDWVRTWAFKMDEAKAKREGFDITPIAGSLAAVDNFPGCPYCESFGFVVCGCGKMSCLSSGALSAQCHWCNTHMENIVKAESFKLKGGGI